MAKSTITDDPVSEQDKFMLRLPKGMRERIKDAAELNGRSMNAEIVARIDEAEVSTEALQKALALLTTLTKRAQDEAKVMRWMIDQQAGLVAVIEEVVESDGKLDDGFMKALRAMLATKGSKYNEFPIADED